MLIGLFLISSSIVIYAFWGNEYSLAMSSIICSIVSLLFFIVGGYFLYKYDQVHKDNEIPPRIIPSLSVIIIFLVAEVCLIYYLATTTFIESNKFMTMMIITGVILDLLVIFVSSVMFMSGIKEYRKNRLK